jgi:hypothetical protein
MKGGKEIMKTEKSKSAVDMDDIMCPVCKEYQMEYFGDICPICGWEHTPMAFIDPDLLGGANRLTLNEYKNWFEEKRKHNPNYKWEEDPNKYEYFSSHIDYKK